MRLRMSVVLTSVALTTGVVSAQNMGRADAKSVLEASAKAMGSTNLKTIEYSGSGWAADVGQNYSTC
jgi:hypothetical protein